MPSRVRNKSVTPVSSDLQPVPERLLVRDLLAGACSLQVLHSCNVDDLERLLFKVLSMQSTHDGEVGPAHTCNDAKPAWWPDDVLAYQEVRSMRDRVHLVMRSWQSALTTVLGSCVKYYATKSATPPATTTTSTTSLVLKRRASCSTTDTPSTPKRRRMVSDTLQPVVLLQDVLKAKYPVLEKSDYMTFLKLQPNVPTTHTPPDDSLALPVKIPVRYPLKIPFSSAYGRKLIVDEKYACMEQLYERKRDWTDSYLTHAAETTPNQVAHQSSMDKRDFDVTFKSKRALNGCEHRYSFPLRQRRQHRNAIDRLRETFCRPLTVRVQQMNMQPYLLKKQMCRRISIYVDKRKTDEFYQERRNLNKTIE